MENDNRNKRIKEMTDAINRIYQEGTSTKYDNDDSALASIDTDSALNRPRSEHVATGMRSGSSSRRVTSVNESDIIVTSSRTRTSSDNARRTRSSSSGSAASRSHSETATRKPSASGSSESSEAAISSTRRYSDVLEANQRRKSSSSGSKKRPTAPSAGTKSSRNNQSAEKKSVDKRSVDKKSGNRKKGLSGFKKFLIIYSAFLLIVIIVVTIVLNSFLKNYEKNQPANVASAIVEQFETSDKLRTFLKDYSGVINQNTAILNYEDAFVSAVEGKKIAYIEDPSRSTSEITCYRITADSMPVASITLTKGEKGSFGLSSWVLASIDTSNAFSDVKTYSILVPEGSKVIVNGTELGESMISGTGVPEVLQTSSRFISAPPTYSTYNVKVVGDEIEVSGTDQTGANLVFSRTENSFVAGGQASEEFIESVKDRVESGLREYALWFIYNAFNLDDYIVDGCELSAYLFGGEFDGETYDPINPWLYNFEEIEDFEFSVFEAKNYTKYSDDCFTVDISYKLDITFTDPSYSDNNQKLDATWVWVKQGDTWYLSASKTY